MEKKGEWKRMGNGEGRWTGEKWDMEKVGGMENK